MGKTNFPALSEEELKNWQYRTIMEGMKLSSMPPYVADPSKLLIDTKTLMPGGIFKQEPKNMPVVHHRVVEPDRSIAQEPDDYFGLDVKLRGALSELSLVDRIARAVCEAVQKTRKTHTTLCQGDMLEVSSVFSDIGLVVEVTMAADGSEYDVSLSTISGAPNEPPNPITAQQRVDIEKYNTYGLGALDPKNTPW